MGIDINSVHNIANALASGERNAANRGKCVNQKGWVTKEQMRKDAAQKTIAILIIICAAKFLFKIIVSFGKWSLRTFGPKWGWIINITGLALLIIIPACTMKVAEASKEAAAAEAAEQERIRIENYTKQKNAEIDAYRSEVREKVNLLAERCEAEGMSFDEVVKVYEENSKITWKSGMTDDYVRNEIDRAFQSCVEAIDKYHTEKIWKVEDYINKLVADLNSKTTPAAYYHIAQFRDKMGDKDRGRHHVLNYKLSYERIKEQIDAEYQVCINKIRSMNGFKEGVGVSLGTNLEPNDDSVFNDVQSGDEKAQKEQEEVSSFGTVSDVNGTDAKTKIDQYVKERETALQQLAKQDIQCRGDYYVEMFKRKMIHKSIGGIIDYDSSFDSVKRKIDEAYLEAEQKINAASGK